MRRRWQDFWKRNREWQGSTTRGWFPHPDHEIARRQMMGFGGMVTVTLDSDLAGTIRFVEALELFRLAASLGGVESLVSIPATSSHFGLSAEERAATGVPRWHGPPLGGHRRCRGSDFGFGASFGSRQDR